MILYGKNINNKNNRGTKPSVFLAIGICIITFLFLFVPMYTSVWVILLLIIDILYISIERNIKIKINLSTTLWYLFIFLGIASMTWSNSNLFEGVKYVVSLAIFYLNYILLSANKNWCDTLINILFLISSFFMLGSILQMIAPDYVLEINKLHLNDSQFDIARGMFRDGFIVGFTYQTGINGYIISMFMAIILMKISIYKKRKIKLLLIIMYILAFYLLFMTGKRGFILFNIIVFLFFIIKLSKYKFRAFIPIILFIFMNLLMLSYTEVGNRIVRRTIMNNDISTGRWRMAKLMWYDFLDSPIIGNGIYTTIDTVNAYHGHNIYLQVLRETGLLGFIPFICIIVFSLFSSIVLLNNTKNSKLYRYVVGFSLYMQIIFIFWGVTGNPLYDLYALLVYFISIAIIAAVKNDIETGISFKVPELKK